MRNRKSPSSRNIPLPEPTRLRQVPAQFSWIDRRLVRHGHLRHCGDLAALSLYLFLVTVADSQGLSYYSEARLLEHLPLQLDELRAARRRLIEIELIAYRKPFYQVLGLQDAEVLPVPVCDAGGEARQAPGRARSTSSTLRPKAPAKRPAGDSGQDPAAARERLRETLEKLREDISGS